MTDQPISEDTESKEKPPALQCLGGRPAPDFLAADLGVLLELGKSAQDGFWEVLGPCLGEDLDNQIERAIDDFAKQHDVRGSQVAKAIRSCRFLVLGAAKINAEKHVLATDLGTLMPEDAERLREILLPGYEDAKPKVRAGAIIKTILDHGRLLTDVSWRLDRISASQHGLMDAPVALLTLTFQEGETRTRETFHADLPMLNRLKMALDSLLA